MPRRDYYCDGCKAALGLMRPSRTSDYYLDITSPGVMVCWQRDHHVIRCSCGHDNTWYGGIRWDALAA
jgi:hypothetical protein